MMSLIMMLPIISQKRSSKIIGNHYLMFKALLLINMTSHKVCDPSKFHPTNYNAPVSAADAIKSPTHAIPSGLEEH